MAIHTDPPKPGLKCVAKDDLQKLPMAEVEKRLGASPDGLSEEKAKKRLDISYPKTSPKREIELRAFRKALSK